MQNAAPVEGRRPHFKPGRQGCGAGSRKPNSPLGFESLSLHHTGQAKAHSRVLWRESKWTMRDIAPPAIKVTQQQLECVKCGARSHATCSCGVSYRPAQERVAEYDKANPGKSTRMAAADLGVSDETVRKARHANPLAPETVTGRDGKEYPATRPPTQTPVMVEHGIITKLANELVDAGYKALTARFSDDQPTLARLKQVRDDLLSHVNNHVEWF
jgi:hypothetical protein